MTDDPRAGYWNDNYYQYWKERVEEAEQQFARSTVVANDSTVPAEQIFDMLLTRAGFSDGTVLDVGCAWGRFFPLLKAKGLSVYGVDISNRMAEEARKSHLAVEVRVATAESLPYHDDSFEFIFCVGVFDATFQHKAIGEFLRILKLGGTALITGKSTNYLPDDDEASLAEAGARRKGEPNNFTDVPSMVKQLLDRDHHIMQGFYFIRRGDFGQARFVTVRPSRFYEYCIAIEKGSNQIDFEPFAFESSGVCG